MPFGLKNGPSVFQRFITIALRDLIRAGLMRGDSFEDSQAIVESIEEVWVAAEIVKVQYNANDHRLFGVCGDRARNTAERVTYSVCESVPIPRES